MQKSIFKNSLKPNLLFSTIIAVAPPTCWRVEIVFIVIQGSNLRVVYSCIYILVRAFLRYYSLSFCFRISDVIDNLGVQKLRSLLFYPNLNSTWFFHKFSVYFSASRLKSTSSHSVQQPNSRVSPLVAPKSLFLQEVLYHKR